MDNDNIKLLKTLLLSYKRFIEYFLERRGTTRYPQGTFFGDLLINRPRLHEIMNEIITILINDSADRKKYTLLYLYKAPQCIKELTNIIEHLKYLKDNKISQSYYSLRMNLYYTPFPISDEDELDLLIKNRDVNGLKKFLFVLDYDLATGVSYSYT